jgi:hypothetical protein
MRSWDSPRFFLVSEVQTASTGCRWRTTVFAKCPSTFEAWTLVAFFPRAFLGCYDLVPQSVEDRGKLVSNRHNGSDENMKHGDSSRLLITGL